MTTSHTTTIALAGAAVAAIQVIQGLLKTLPDPESGWSQADRAKWLQTAANIFDLIYKGDGGGISVTPARADRSPRPGEH